MPTKPLNYRFCYVNVNDVIAMGEDRECESEMAAMDYACGLLSLDHPRVEVWQNSTRIFVIKWALGRDALPRGSIV
jgi:hypothetical protein